jgi:3-hydroxybutyryl-CoA dehydrogenase
MVDQLIAAKINVGVVGLGLMGSSIVVALLLSDHPVAAVAPLPGEAAVASLQIARQLAHCENEAIMDKPVDYYLERLTISGKYDILAGCSLVLECVVEDAGIKEQVYLKISNTVANDALIASNTSAIPISLLQKYVPNPGRFLGIHWAEPAFLTRFLEITCGEQTDLQYAEWAVRVSHLWGKESTLLKKDIRGFVTNRLMYAMCREALALADNGDATIEDMDKAVRYDAGSWMTMMGVFRRMDYLGLDDMKVTFSNIFPRLSNSDNVPVTMQKLIDLKAKGVQSLTGFYDYESDEAAEWNEAFAAFNKEINQLAIQYPSQVSNSFL